MNGISDVTVANETDAVSFNYSSDMQLELATKTLSDLGYPVVGESNSIPKKAKSFVSCAVGRMRK